MQNRDHSGSQSALAPLQRILETMKREGGFEAALLTSLDGLPIATVPPDYDSDVAAAMVALIQRVSHDAREELEMAGVDEVTIRDQDYTRLVCRYLDVDGQQMILAALVPDGNYYRRATNRAIHEIKTAMQL
jgi:predicted regulator of Ras-like GTPase activity (Roadblock/LC7/MglB family)